MKLENLLLLYVGVLWSVYLYYCHRRLKKGERKTVITLCGQQKNRLYR